MFKSLIPPSRITPVQEERYMYARRFVTEEGFLVEMDDMYGEDILFPRQNMGIWRWRAPFSRGLGYAEVGTLGHFLDGGEPSSEHIEICWNPLDNDSLVGAKRLRDLLIENSIPYRQDTSVIAAHIENLEADTERLKEYLA